VTELEIGKAFREVDDVRPRLVQIAWPWDNEGLLSRDVEQLDGTAVWETPCDEDNPEQPEVEGGAALLTISPLCGMPAGQRQPDGSREPGTIISIQGAGFRPGEEAEIVINPQSIPEFRLVEGGERVHLIPDENGEVSYDFMMPSINIPSTAVGSTPVRVIMRQSEATGTLRINSDLQLAGEAMIETIFLALMATVVGMVLAVPVSFIAARNLMTSSPVTVAIYYVVRLILNVIRSIEPLVWALIAIIWVGPGPFAGTIALTLHTIAALGKLYSEAIENIDTGPIEALQATGANRLQTIIYAVVPQIVPPFVSFTIYRWDINVRLSTIIGAVGGGGIGFILIQWIRLSRYDSVGVAVWLIAIVVTVLDYASARIREVYV
jgi:phosphonate transport system permease protein